MTQTEKRRSSWLSENRCCLQGSVWGIFGHLGEALPGEEAVVGIMETGEEGEGEGEVRLAALSTAIMDPGSQATTLIH